MSQAVKMDSRREGPAVTRPVYQIERMSKSFGAFRALQDVNLTLNKGEFGAVIGSSGCGKSTLLKIMGGLMPPSSGRVVLVPITHLSFNLLLNRICCVCFVMFCFL